jgi:hypothetical protein
MFFRAPREREVHLQQATYTAALAAEALALEQRSPIDRRGWDQAVDSYTPVNLPVNQHEDRNTTGRRRQTAKVRL